MIYADTKAYLQHRPFVKEDIEYLYVWSFDNIGFIFLKQALTFVKN